MKMPLYLLAEKIHAALSWIEHEKKLDNLGAWSASKASRPHKDFYLTHHENIPI